MKLQIVAFLFAVAAGSIEATQLRNGKVAICKAIEPGVLYKERAIKKGRVAKYTGPDHDALPGRCGPDNCAILCKGAKSFESTGAGAICECKH